MLFITILNKLQFYKNLGENPTFPVWLMSPNLIGEKVKFPNTLRSIRVITWITDKRHGDYLIEVTLEEWNKVCDGELSLKEIPERELPYVDFSFNTFLNLRSINKFIGVLPDTPKYTTIQVHGENISIHWNEFYEFSRAIAQDTYVVKIRGYEAKIDDLFIAIMYFLRVPTKDFFESRMSILKGLISKGFSGEQLHLVFSGLIEE